MENIILSLEYNFKEQLSISEKSINEIKAKLISINCELLETNLTNKKAVDAVIKLNDMEVSAEIKSEIRADDRNIFIETISNTDKQTIGGPRRALLENAELIVYHFMQNNVVYIFETKKLVEATDKLISEYPETKKFIKNKNYYTEGYALSLRTVLDTLGIDNYIKI